MRSNYSRISLEAMQQTKELTLRALRGGVNLSAGRLSLMNGTIPFGFGLFGYV
jgi:hypothetical protein